MISATKVLLFFELCKYFGNFLTKNRIFAHSNMHFLSFSAQLNVQFEHFLHGFDNFAQCIVQFFT